MGKKLIKKEAKRIANELIKINKSNKSMEELVISLTSESYMDNLLKIMLYIPTLIAENNLSIISSDPFEIESK